MYLTVRELIDFLEEQCSENAGLEDYIVTIDEVSSIEIDISHPEKEIILYRGE